MPTATALEPCRVCRDAAPREGCYLAMAGDERPICRACWEQALLDVRRVERRIRAGSDAARFRIF